MLGFAALGERALGEIEISELTDYVVTADAAAFVLTFQDSVLEATRLFAAEPASFVLTGQNAGLPVNMPGDVATLAIAGQNAGLRATRLLRGAVAPFTLTAPSIAVNRSIPLEAAAFVITGFAAELFTGTRLRADVSNFLITGQASSSLRNLILRAQTNLAAQVDFFLFSPLGGVALGEQVVEEDVVGGTTYAITGRAGLIYARIMRAETAAFVLAGQDASAIFTMPADAAEYELTGLDVTLRAMRTMPADAAAFELNGLATSTKTSRQQLRVRASGYNKRRVLCH